MIVPDEDTRKAETSLFSYIDAIASAIVWNDSPQSLDAHDLPCEITFQMKVDTLKPEPARPVIKKDILFSQSLPMPGEKRLGSQPASILFNPDGDMDQVATNYSLSRKKPETIGEKIEKCETLAQKMLAGYGFAAVNCRRHYTVDGHVNVIISGNGWPLGEKSPNIEGRRKDIEHVVTAKADNMSNLGYKDRVNIIEGWVKQVDPYFRERFSAELNEKNHLISATRKEGTPEEMKGQAEALCELALTGLKNQAMYEEAGKELNHLVKSLNDKQALQKTRNRYRTGDSAASFSSL